MPRIKGLGELDWNFHRGNPIYSPYTFAAELCLSFIIELNPEFDSVGLNKFACCNGEFTERGTPFSGCHPSSLETIEKLQEVAYAVQKLSLIYTHGVKVAPGDHQSLLLTIAVPRLEAEIQWPSKFVESIARKLEGWVKEYRREHK